MALSEHHLQDDIGAGQRGREHEVCCAIVGPRKDRESRSDQLQPSQAAVDVSGLDQDVGSTPFDQFQHSFFVNAVNTINDYR